MVFDLDENRAFQTVIRELAYLHLSHPSLPKTYLLHAMEMASHFIDMDNAYVAQRENALNPKSTASAVAHYPRGDENAPAIAVENVISPTSQVLQVTPPQSDGNGIGWEAPEPDDEDPHVLHWRQKRKAEAAATIKRLTTPTGISKRRRKSSIAGRLARLSIASQDAPSDISTRSPVSHRTASSHVTTIDNSVRSPVSRSPGSSRATAIDRSAKSPIPRRAASSQATSINMCARSPVSRHAARSQATSIESSARSPVCSRVASSQATSIDGNSRGTRTDRSSSLKGSNTTIDSSSRRNHNAGTGVTRR